MRRWMHVSSVRKYPTYAFNSMVNIAKLIYIVPPSQQAQGRGSQKRPTTVSKESKETYYSVYIVPPSQQAQGRGRGCNLII